MALGMSEYTSAWAIEELPRSPALHAPAYTCSVNSWMRQKTFKIEIAEDLPSIDVQRVRPLRWRALKSVYQHIQSLLSFKEPFIENLVVQLDPHHTQAHKELGTTEASSKRMRRV